MKKAIDFFEFYVDRTWLLFGTVLAGLLKSVLEFVEIYLFKDWQVLAFILIVIHIDTVLGLYYGIKTKQVSSKKFAAYFEKIGLYFCVLMVLHALYYFPVEGFQTLFGWFKNLSYVLIVVREAISVFEKIGKIRPGLINPNILSYLKNFDASGKYSDLQNPNPK